MKSIWHDITTTALIGVERQPLNLGHEPLLNSPASVGTPELTVSTESPTLPNTLAKLDRSDPAATLLTAAAAACVYKRAGTLPATALVAAPEPAAADTRRECPAGAAHLLAMICGDYKAVAPEALEILDQAGMRPPATLLPELIDLGRQNTNLRDAILRVIDSRGLWLAGQNPDWSYAASGVEAVDWTTAPRPARVATFYALGLTDPAEARRLLQSTWAEDGAEDRAALLDAREEGLSADDEPFLEAALDDRSSTVREVAAGLLARLPGSAYSARMTERVRSLLRHSYKFIGGHRLDVSPPDDADASLTRDLGDGKVTAKASQASGEGEKASRLRRMVAAVPPRQLSAILQIPAAEIVRLAEKNEWSVPLLRGIAQAGGRHPDAEWTLALLGEIASRPALADNAFWNSIEPAVRALPIETLERVLTAELARAPLAAPGPARRLLALHRGRWSPAFAQTFAAKVRETLAQFSDVQTYGAIMAILPEIVLYVPPDLADDFAAMLDGAIMASPTYWTSTIRKFINTLRFRGDLRKALLETTTP